MVNHALHLCDYDTKKSFGVSFMTEFKTRKEQVLK